MMYRTLCNTPADKKFYKKCWWFFSFFLIIFYISYIYSDLVITYEHSIEFIHSILRGRPFQFFIDSSQYHLQNIVYSRDRAIIPIYDIPVYLIMAVWNIPLVIAESFGIDIYNSFICFIWVKLLLVLAAVLMVYLIGLIADDLGCAASQKSSTIFYTATSILVVIPILIVTQYDVFSIIFTLLGIHYFIKNDTVKFLLFFMIAATFKLFSFIIFLPLLLLKEKRISRIIGSVLCIFLPILILRAIFPFHHSEAKVASRLISFIYSRSFSIGNNSFYIFIAAFCTLLFSCYRYQKIQDHLELVPWISLVSIALLFLFAETHPYWIILIVPYISLCLFFSKRNLFQGMILEMILSISYILESIFHFYWCYSQKILANMALPNILGSLEPDTWDLSVIDALNILGFYFEPSHWASIFNTCFVTALVLFIIHTYPFHKEDPSVVLGSVKAVILWRLLITIAIGICPIVIYLGLVL